MKNSVKDVLKNFYTYINTNWIDNYGNCFIDSDDYQGKQGFTTIDDVIKQYFKEIGGNPLNVDIIPFPMDNEQPKIIEKINLKK